MIRIVSGTHRVIVLRNFLPLCPARTQNNTVQLEVTSESRLIRLPNHPGPFSSRDGCDQTHVTSDATRCVTRKEADALANTDRSVRTTDDGNAQGLGEERVCLHAVTGRKEV